MKIVVMYIALFTASIRGYEGPPLDPLHTHCMAHAVYHEARGEPFAGQVMVAQVIMNRVNHDRHPDNPCDVVYEPHQFTNIKKTIPDYDSDAWKLAVGISAHVLSEIVVDMSGGATMYKNPEKATAKWDYDKLAYLGNVGQHHFFLEK